MPKRHSDNKAEIKKLIKKAVPGLKGKKHSTKINAMRELAALGSAATEIVDKLLPFVHDKDDTMRSEAMRALAEIGMGSKLASTQVRALLKNFKVTEDPYFKCRVYWILEHIET